MAPTRNWSVLTCKPRHDSLRVLEPLLNRKGLASPKVNTAENPGSKPFCSVIVEVVFGGTGTERLSIAEKKVVRQLSLSVDVRSGTFLMCPTVTFMVGEMYLSLWT
ncbi:hypothetical protein B0H12DRAFT_81720 [Mycena haematopus]|nr:hypothetical protein B0H12DRAFT_81720 [Mycena haematopus]